MSKSPLTDLFDFFISKFKVKKTRKRVGIFIIYEEYNLTSGYLKLFTTLKLIFNEYVGEILAGAKINNSAATAARYKSPQKANTETIYLSWLLCSAVPLLAYHFLFKFALICACLHMCRVNKDMVGTEQPLVSNLFQDAVENLLKDVRVLEAAFIVLAEGGEMGTSV